MSIASRFEPFDRDKVFYDLETWESMFAEELKASPAVADSLAWLLYRVIRELDKGKKGRVINTLKLGVEWIFQYTDAHKLCLQGYLHHLEGLLVPGDVPEEVMKGVIERGEAEATRAYAEDADGKGSTKRKPVKKGKRKG